jgi:hypothetical protein
MQLSREALVTAYRDMVTIRRVTALHSASVREVVRYNR